jgi:hypothetical protein
MRPVNRPCASDAGAESTRHRPQCMACKGFSGCPTRCRPRGVCSRAEELLGTPPAEESNVPALRHRQATLVSQVPSYLWRQSAGRVQSSGEGVGSVRIAYPSPMRLASARRRRRMERDPAGVEINLGLGIDGQGGAQRVAEGGLELPDGLEAGVELAVQRRPGESGSTASVSAAGRPTRCRRPWQRTAYQSPGRSP